MQEQRWADWNAWCEAKIFESFDKVFNKAIGDCIGQREANLRKELRKEIANMRRELATARQQIKQLERHKPIELQSQIWALQRALNVARREIKTLQAEPNKQIIGWKLDRRAFLNGFLLGRRRTEANMRRLLDAMEEAALLDDAKYDIDELGSGDANN